MYYLYINQIKTEYKALEISSEKKEQREWIELETLAGRVLQSGHWGESDVLILKADNERDAHAIAQNDPLHQYALVDLEIIPYTDQLPYLEPHMQEVSSFDGSSLEVDDLLDENLDCKLVCLDEVKSIKVDGFKSLEQNQAPQKTKADNVILVLDGMIEAMVDHTLGDVQKFQIFKTRKDSALKDLAKDAAGGKFSQSLSFTIQADS